MQKKILYVTHRFWPHPGGSERLFYEFARRSAQDGYSVTVYTTDAWDPESYHKPWKARVQAGLERHDGLLIRRFRIKNIPLQFKVLGSLSLLPIDPVRLLFGHPHVLLPEFLREVFVERPKFDLIVAGVLPHGELLYPAAWLASYWNVPWICVPLAHVGARGEAPQPGYLTGPQIRLMKRANLIATATAAENRALEAHDVDPSKLCEVGVGIEPDAIVGGQAQRFRETYHIDGPIVLQISTQTFAKGSMDIIEAMKILWAAGSQASLVLIGQLTDQFEEYLLAQAPTVYERTLVLGLVDHDTKRDAIAACDLFVMASRADSFGVVYLEAWLCGKPVVGADAGGVPYVITDGRDGLLVKFGDTRGLADRISTLLGDPTLCRSLSESGRAKALSRYTLKGTCDRMSEATSRVLPR